MLSVSGFEPILATLKPIEAFEILKTGQNCMTDRFRLIGIGVVLLLFSLLGAPEILAAHLSIAYPGEQGLATDKRDNYYIALLDLALTKAGVQYELKPYAHPMVRARLWKQLEADDGVNVDWGPVTPEIERRMLPIRISLDKGLLGWRLFLINARDRPLFEHIQTLDQLKSLVAAQQTDWPDTVVLRDNGLKVIGVSDFQNLHRMLVAGRFQYFPRGVGEIWREKQVYSTLGLEVESHLALHYTALTYFFVSKKNQTLAKVIEQGLLAAIKDGSFEKLFEQYNGAAIRMADLSSRTVFELHNPLMPGAASQELDRLPHR